jgi:hypothetical protein
VAAEPSVVVRAWIRTRGEWTSAAEPRPTGAGLFSRALRLRGVALLIFGPRRKVIVMLGGDGAVKGRW